MDRGSLQYSFRPLQEAEPVVWHREKDLIAYPKALEYMENRVDSIISGHGKEFVWLIEHPPLYTAGTSAHREDLLYPDRLPVYAVGRGGQYTYHGPGQRIAYVMLDLKKRKMDLRAFIACLEEWIILTLKEFDIIGRRHEDRVGVWVQTNTESFNRKNNKCISEKKIAAIGLRIRKWVSFHGIAINVAPDLNHYEGIVPCGIKDYGVTSFADLGISIKMEELDAVLKKYFFRIFGELVEI